MFLILLCFLSYLVIVLVFWMCCLICRFSVLIFWVIRKVLNGEMVVLRLCRSWMWVLRMKVRLVFSGLLMLRLWV